MHHRISPRHLGALLVEPFCPRCYFYQLQMRFKLPFDRPMPGIMYNLDIFEKSIVEAHQASEGELPAWLSDLGCVSSIDFPAKMTMEFPDFDVTMVGMPDAVFKKSNGKLCVIDYKSAKYKGEDDPFMPIYQTQLLGYAHLLESNKIGKVDSAALVYFQNELKEFESTPLELITEKGFNAPFTVKIHEVEIDRDELNPLLKRFREFAEMKTAPEGLERCRNCALLEQLFSIEQNMRNQEDSHRQRDPYFRKIMYPTIEARRHRAKNAWDLDQDDDFDVPCMEFHDSVPASWDI